MSMEDAPCSSIDPEMFFPQGNGGAKAIANRRAVAICRTCDVAARCLEYALANDERWGVWGATTERDRARMRRKAS